MRLVTYKNLLMNLELEDQIKELEDKNNKIK